ncbi:2,4-dienoyl-CoA reductase-like NADH-dependent reductase (Old Yellow Enzyme family) [Paenibacillus castaneae]|uniref:NADH-dependent flavin oxidoreductase n=1 Tax=Paenibacillus castaneae TaxID=474957 RepID=UPI000C9BB069|nr:NADH-dependent flavin oxidoreductase [Paenibacillus castaneae]NIK75396.1 2,4-dienoyl-CoA reductase-like NADH-dependent reductase (Old Yellow Enzyme family) [Paenibacillus castaneae]
MNSKSKVAFKPFTFRSGIEIKNRIVMAPMTNTASHDNGEVSDEEVAYYHKRAGGVGMVITACTYVTRNGKGFPGEFGADSDFLIPSLKRVATTIQEKGSKAILQIFHGGRMCPPELLPDLQPIAPSAVAAEREDAIKPREMTAEEITDMVKAFGEATRRAIEAGYDGVEIHGANTYLIQQFFSPHSNRRTDQWGGTLEKRMAFPLAVVEAVKKAVKEHAKKPFIIGYRLSPEERENPGITMDDTLHLVDRLADQQLDYLHISVGAFWNGSIRDANDQTSRGVMIHDRVGDRIPVMGVGMLRTPDEVMKALETGIPLIALGRELIMEPHWVQKVEAGEEEKIRTTLSKEDQKELVISDQMWEYYTSIPGWFPIV